jgi:hypothetical protein
MQYFFHKAQIKKKANKEVLIQCLPYPSAALDIHRILCVKFSQSTEAQRRAGGTKGPSGVTDSLTLALSGIAQAQSWTVFASRILVRSLENLRKSVQRHFCLLETNSV